MPGKLARLSGKQLNQLNLLRLSKLIAAEGNFKSGSPQHFSRVKLGDKLKVHAKQTPKSPPKSFTRMYDINTSARPPKPSPQTHHLLAQLHLPSANSAPTTPRKLPRNMQITHTNISIMPQHSWEDMARRFRINTPIRISIILSMLAQITKRDFRRLR